MLQLFKGPVLVALRSLINGGNMKEVSVTNGLVVPRVRGVQRLNLGDLMAAGLWKVTCRDVHGRVKWEEVIENLVVNAGLDYLLDTGLSGGTPITVWYLGLTDGTPTVAATDTMAAHAGWAEVTGYNEAARPTWVDGGVSGQSVDNSGSPATFTASGSITVGGAFLTSVSTKGGATGTLYAAGAFTGGDRSLNASETIDVTATFTQAAA